MSRTMRYFCDRTPKAELADGMIHISAHSGDGRLRCTMPIRHFVEFIAEGADLVEDITNGRNVVPIDAKAGGADK